MKTVKILIVALALSAGLAGCMVSVDPPPRSVVVVRDPYAPVRTVSASVNLRTCPSTSCGVIMTLRKGDNVRVIGRDGSWVNVVVIGPETEGWMSSNYLFW
jgi:uncharacterized protein YgiM (DUF1202 family)